MRKYIKNNILEIFETLHEAHEIIAKYMDNKKFDNACNLLADCQDTATQLFNIIEESEGEEFVTLSLINEYYEELFNITSDLSKKNNGSNVKNRLNKRIDKAEASARNDIKVRLEIVFMPYKASMWDSLESVWKAADEDPDCDAYVVPIPYFDRKPDHSFGEFHYEGDEYPDHVPVVHYNSYNLKQRRPDVIYIHNPYDGNNFVTSVHPNFYSSELKKYTDCLVYIPYYVVGTKVNHALLNLACAEHVDRIIIQSKAVCEDFKKAYQNSINQNKFVALGSPKFDAIVNSSRSDYIIPKEWGDIINGRKSVLYNSSIVSVLSNPVLYLQKMVAIFNYFKDNKDYVLWWRPHPLLESTFKSMISPLSNEYIRLRNIYIDLSIGVYDDTSDLYRALICTDMYYGDLRSSISVLYSATGKPMTFVHIGDAAPVSTFEEDCINHSHDNSSLEILKRNKNCDGTAGYNIYQYIKGELM